MSFLHTHSSECLKSELDLFSLPPTQTSIESSQWIHYKPDFSFRRFTDRIRRPWSRRGISRSYAYPAESTRTREIGRRINGPSSRNKRYNHGNRRRPRKSFTSFHFQSGRHVFQSKARVASKQRLRVPRVYRSLIKLFLAGKKFSSNFKSMGRRYSGAHGRNAGDKRQCRTRKTLQLHSRQTSGRSYRTSPLRRF